MDIKGKIFLAPMAGVADYPFRLLCKEAGADIVCSEMISAKAVLYGDEKTFKLAALRDSERPAGIQLFGSDPAVMAEAARRISSLRPDYIDINMGCPVRKVFSNGEGSALLNDPEKAAAITEAVVKAAGDIPVSVKMRLGTEKEPTAALRLAGLARESGASFITVHGRTREQMYSGRADLDAIARVVSEARIPVVGNGDITDPESAALMYKKTGCDALAISYGTCHGANKGRDTKIRREIAIAIKEAMRHEQIDGFLVSHGSSTVPQYIVREINAMGGKIENAHGIPIEQLVDVSHCGISKINVDTDIRLAVTRNMKELFRDNPSLRESSSIGEIYRLLETNLPAFDPRVFFPPIMDTITSGIIPDADVAKIIDCVERGVKEVIGTLIVQFGSYGKAPEVERISLEQMAARYQQKGI